MEKYGTEGGEQKALSAEDKALRYVLHTTIKKVTEDIGDRFNFNTAISSIMELVNEIYKYKDGEVNVPLLRETIKKLVVILAPFVPHITEEMWEHLGGTTSVHEEKWPSYDEKALVKDTVEIVLQLNGKVKDKIAIQNGAGKEEMEKAALASEKIQALTEGKKIIKVIAVPGRLVNIVAK